MNGQYIQRLDDDEFLRRIEPFLPSAGQHEALRIMAPHLKERLKRLCQVREHLEFLYADELDVDPDLLAKQGSAPPAADALRSAIEALASVKAFEEQTIEQALEDEFATHPGWKKRSFFMPIRVAVSASTQTPPLMPMLAALGRDRTLFRLRDALDRLSAHV
jgi:glutamyl-tRNA synthetase